jgi:two-component system, cell cycle sensor histidine kinase and response regulator CckA
MQSYSQPSTAFEAELPALKQYLSLFIIVCIGISVVQCAIWLYSGYFLDLVGWVVPLMLALILGYARHLTIARQPQRAVIIVSVTFFLIAIGGALITGGLVLQAIFVPLTGLVIALPFLSARAMRPLIVMGWLSTAAAVLASLIVRPFMPMPSWTPLVTATISLIILAILMRLFWLHHLHLIELINKREQATHELQRARDSLEQQVVLRTTELSQGRELYYSLIRNIPRGSVMVFDHDLRYLLAEGPGLTEWDYHKQPIVGKTIWDLYPPDLCAFLEPKRRAALAGQYVQYELRHQQHVYDVQIVPLRNEAGEVTSGLIVSQNITDRDRAEQALRESEDRYRQLVELSPDAVIVHQNPTIVYVNQAALTLFGVTDTNEMLGQDVFEYVAAESQVLIRQRSSQLLIDAKTTPQATWIAQRADGAQIPVESVGNYILFNGIPSIQAIVRDISERRRAEEEQRAFDHKLQETQRLESLGVLVGGIAHDFNNLLMGMLGNAALALADLGPDHVVREPIERVEQAAIRAAELIRQMLAYAGKGRYSVGMIDLNTLIIEMHSLLHASIQRSVTLELDLGTTLPLIEGDVAQIRQVVMNLLVNAAEAIGDQPGTITVTTRLTTASATPNEAATDQGARHYLHLRVQDTGSGMDAYTLARIFEPFFTTKFTGRGLGLAAVQGIIRSHQGMLTVESSVGVGSTFDIYLPAQEYRFVDHDPYKLLPEPARQPVVDQGTVLIIDDEEGIRTVVSRMVHRLGYQTITAIDGATGMEVFRERRSELCCVLLDVAMPGLSGVQILPQLQAIDQTIPIVLMSGYTEQELVASLEGSWEQNVLTKPFTLEVLRQRLQGMLRPQA